MKILKEQAQKITSLEIQGATNIANYGISIFKEFAERNIQKPLKELLDLLKKAKNIIAKSRYTEPAMYNGLRYVMNKIHKMRNNGNNDSKSIVEKTIEASNEYMDLMKESKKKIAEIGANRIQRTKEGITIMVHCHSSVTTNILIEAKKQGKKFDVICTETRPKYQGRLTAEELLDAGIKTTMVVDSAMRWTLRNHEISFILIGADAITSEGTVLNKIGSRLLALAARELHVPFYVATPLFKFNPESAFGNLEKIDMRSEEEIWLESERPKNLKILNPAFETISRRYISGLITDEGIFPASSVSLVFQRTYPHLIEEKILNSDNIM